MGKTGRKSEEARLKSNSWEGEQEGSNIGWKKSQPTAPLSNGEFINQSHPPEVL